MAGSYYVAIYRNGEVIFADKYRDSSEYIPYLIRIARLVDELTPDATLKTGQIASKGVIGAGIAWEKPETWFTLEKQVVKSLANAARAVGLNY